MRNYCYNKLTNPLTVINKEETFSSNSEANALKLPYYISYMFFSVLHAKRCL